MAGHHSKRCDVNYAASACFFSISRLSRCALIESVSSLAFLRNASRPPRWSTDFKALAEMRSLTERPSASDIRVTFKRFGRNRRLVLIFEWLTRWPTRGPLPVRSQRRDMVEILGNDREPAGPIQHPFGGAGPIKSAPQRVKLRGQGG